MDDQLKEQLVRLGFLRAEDSLTIPFFDPDLPEETRKRLEEMSKGRLERIYTAVKKLEQMSTNTYDDHPRTVNEEPSESQIRYRDLVEDIKTQIYVLNHPKFEEFLYRSLESWRAGNAPKITSFHHSDDK